MKTNSNKEKNLEEALIDLYIFIKIQDSPKRMEHLNCLPNMIKFTHPIPKRGQNP